MAAIVSTSDDVITAKCFRTSLPVGTKPPRKLWGYTEEEAVGKHISLIIPPDRLSEEDFIISQIAAGKKVDHFETIRCGKHGQEVHLSVTVSPVVDNQGTIIGALRLRLCLLPTPDKQARFIYLLPYK